MLLLLQIAEIASRYQLHTSLPSRSELHIRQKFQRTSKQLKSAYLDLQYSCTVFWVSSFHLSVNIVVLYLGVVPVHGPWSRISKTSQQKLKREVSRMEKRFKIAIMFSGRRRRSREERNGFVKEDVIK